MNVLAVGDPSALFPYVPQRNYLLVHDGSFGISGRARAFDPLRHQFNPLKDMSYRKARDLRDILSETFPEGGSTLTKAGGLSYILTRLVKDRPRSFADLVPEEPTKKDAPGLHWAYDKLSELSLSPVLEHVLDRNLFGFSGTIHAVLDAQTLTDFDRRFLGRLLIASYPGTVVVPDFPFFAMPSHVQLIHEGRLIAGIRSFSQLPALKADLLFMETIVAARATAEDAEILAANRSKHAKGTVGYVADIAQHMAAP